MHVHAVSTRPFAVTCFHFVVDGHHKLIRWGFVVHAGIDGYSQLITYMRCATDNRAATVYRLFVTAVEQYGLPSRLRCDQGRENVRVAEHMILCRGADRGSIIVGSSVHNQRIERLWRDMHRCVTSVYYRLFYYMEQNGFLNPIDTNHLFALQYVYLPRINQSLEIFCEGWNNHGLRSEHHQTPLQLFTAGVINQELYAYASDDVHDFSSYGVVEDGLAPAAGTVDEEEGVHVPPLNVTLTDAQSTYLLNAVNPLADSDAYGMDLYQQTLDIIFDL